MPSIFAIPCSDLIHIQYLHCGTNTSVSYYMRLEGNKACLLSNLEIFLKQTQTHTHTHILMASACVCNWNLNLWRQSNDKWLVSHVTEGYSDSSLSHRSSSSSSSSSCSHVFFSSSPPSHRLRCEKSSTWTLKTRCPGDLPGQLMTLWLEYISGWFDFLSRWWALMWDKGLQLRSKVQSWPSKKRLTNNSAHGAFSSFQSYYIVFLRSSRL